MGRQNRTKIWTFQAKEQWHVLLRDGTLSGNWMCISPEDEAAYRYMCRKMSAHGLSCDDKPPVWGWHSCGGYQQAPDAEVARMLLSDHQLTACQMIMLSLECPADQLLASDYNAWCELVYSPLAVTDYAELGLSVKDHQLFAIKHTPDALIQATLPRIRRDWLIRAQPLVLDSNHEVCILEEGVVGE